MHQDRLMTEMDAEWKITKEATEVAVVVLSKRKAETYGTHARTTRAIVVMVPEVKPVARPASSPPPEEEAPMHDDIPDDPVELRAAVESKIASVARFIELKRRDERGDEGELGRHEPRAVDVDPQRRSG